MSAARTQRRHPKTPAEDLLTTRKEILAFADFLTTNQDWLRKLMASLEIIRQADAQIAKQQAIAAEFKRREALPKWRRWLLRVAREW